MRVALRADASRRIGFGHVKRCLALAAALRAIGADARLITRDLGVDTAAMVRALFLEQLVLPAPSEALRPDHVPHAAWAEVGWQLDAEQSVAALADWRPDWVLVDHYAFDARWHEFVSQRLGTHIAAIDDLADRDQSVELLVDHNLSDDHRQKYAGRVPEKATLLGGPRFALLAPAYAQAARIVVSEQVRSIGIFMGGVDASDLSSLALRACRNDAEFRGRVEVVTTSAYPHGQGLKTLARHWPDTAVLADLPDLASFFARHDLQIGAGGGAAWERCCIGAPTLAISAAANQDAVLPALARLGAVAVVERLPPPDEGAIGAAIRSLSGDPRRRLELSERSRRLVDGLGARRVALRLAARSLAVRPATAADSRTIYEWRNHPATRSVSANPREIPWAEHEKWLNDTLLMTNRCLLVGRVGDVDVGVIRFDSQSENQFEVSLYLDPALHGLGLGRSLLLAGEGYLVRRAPVGRFTATVLEGNTSSARLFASCGYGLQQGIWQKSADSKPGNEVTRT